MLLLTDGTLNVLSEFSLLLLDPLLLFHGCLLSWVIGVSLLLLLLVHLAHATHSHASSHSTHAHAAHTHTAHAHATHSVASAIH